MGLGIRGEGGRWGKGFIIYSYKRKKKVESQARVTKAKRPKDQAEGLRTH